MKFKVLRHQEHRTFATFVSSDEGQIRDANTYLYPSKMPELLDFGTSMEGLKELHRYNDCYTELDNYNLVTIELVVEKESPSPELEKQVLTDYVDWYKKPYPKDPVLVNDYSIEKFTNP